jgi:hypothetical protein
MTLIDRIDLRGRDLAYTLRVTEAALKGVCSGVREAQRAFLTTAGATPAEREAALASLDTEHKAFIAQALAEVAQGLAVDESVGRAVG